MLRGDRARIGEELGLLETELADAPARRAALRDALAEAQAARSAARAAPRRRESAEQVVRAAAELGPAQQSLQQAERRALESAGRLNDARAHHLDLVERRLAGMAAELASGLAAGDPCVVCGSLEHPDPATAAPDAVTAREQQSAERAVKAASDEHELAQHDLQERHRALLPLQQLVGDLDAAAAQQQLERGARRARRERAGPRLRGRRERGAAAPAAGGADPRRAPRRRASTGSEDTATRLEEVSQVVAELRPVVARASARRRWPR